MRVISFSEARNKLKSILDQMVNDAGYTIISHRDADDAVVMALNKFNGLLGTVHLFENPASSENLTIISCRYHYE